MTTELQWYRLISKWVSKVLEFFGEFLKQFLSIVKDWTKSLYLVFKSFLKDIQSNNTSRKIAGIIAFSIIFYVWFFIPVRDTFTWLEFEWKVWAITRTEWVPANDTDTFQSVQAFTDAYSFAYGRDCGWFRVHAVDLAMWRNWGHLTNPTYSCPAFPKYARTKIFPINIGTVIRDREVLTLDALLGRVDYDQQGAKRYTTIQTSLWKLVGEKDWRISDMKNTQRQDF